MLRAKTFHSEPRIDQHLGQNLGTTTFQNVQKSKIVPKLAPFVSQGLGVH